MSKTIDEVLERVKSWPQQRQQDAARVLEAMEHCGTDVYRLSDDEREMVEVGLEQAKRGEFVSDADMAAFWNRNRRREFVTPLWHGPTSTISTSR